MNPASCPPSRSYGQPAIRDRTAAEAARACRYARRGRLPYAMAFPARKGAADIIDLIMADHRRIQRLGSTMRDAHWYSLSSATAWRLGSMWARLAGLIDLHIGAEDEICLVTVYSTDPQGLERMQDAMADHDDIRNAIQEASLQPVGSATWWRAASDVLFACRGAFQQEEHDSLPGFARRATDRQRRNLGRQWQAYVTARIRDRARPGPGSGLACRLCGQQIPASHQHVLDTGRGGVLCSCTGCSVLFHLVRRPG